MWDLVMWWFVVKVLFDGRRSKEWEVQDGGCVVVIFNLDKVDSCMYLNMSQVFYIVKDVPWDISI